MHFIKFDENLCKFLLSGVHILWFKLKRRQFQKVEKRRINAHAFIYIFKNKEHEFIVAKVWILGLKVLKYTHYNIKDLELTRATHGFLCNERSKCSWSKWDF